MAEGVGRSQVVPYVVRLAARGVDVTLHSFEKGERDEAIAAVLADAGVRWHAHPFRAGGGIGGLQRVAEGAALVARAPLVHARSDLAAASAIVANRRRWVWDMRALWREERLALGLLRPGTAEERVMRAVEGGAARRSAAIVTLAHAAVDVLAERYGADVAAKATVITTCVDLERFRPSPLPAPDPIRLLLAGTLSPLYDVPAMVRLAGRLATLRPSQLTVLSPDARTWEAQLDAAGAEVSQASAREMPERVTESHVGLSMRTRDVSNCAATPTKLGEFLASGRPVVVSPGLGDMDDLVARYDCGVVVGDLSGAGLDEAARQIGRLVDDPGTPARCRAVAEEHFDVDRGVDQLLEVYRRTLT